MKIICCADLHLGRVSSVPEDVKDNQKNFSSENAWYRIIDMAVDEEADAILVAGDIFDKDTYEWTSKKILEESLKKLKGKNIQVIMVPGNHDLKLLEKVVKNIKSSSDYDFLKIIGCGCKWESIDLKGLQILGYGLDKDQDKKNPFERFYQYINLNEKYILMLHGDYTTNDSKYAPFRESLSGEQIQNSLITLIGHTHKYEDNGKYISLGSPQANDFGEKGPHGVLVLDLDSNFNIINREYRQISNIYYDQVNVDVNEEKDLSVLLNSTLVNKSDLTYYRVVLNGRISKEKHKKTEEDIKELCDENAKGYIKDGVYIDTEVFINNTFPNFDIEAISKQKNAKGVIANIIKSIDENSFFEKYEDEFNSFKEIYTDYLKNYMPEKFTDEEVSLYIKEALITFLESDKE